jgi:hypothetical protein
MGCLLPFIFVAVTVSSWFLWGWHGVLIAGSVVIVSYINLFIVLLSTQFGKSHFLKESVAVSVVTGLAAWVLWIIDSATALSIDLRWLSWLFIAWGLGIVYSAWEDAKERKH